MSTLHSPLLSTFGGIRNHGQLHRLWLHQGHEPRHGLWQQSKSNITMALNDNKVTHLSSFLFAFTIQICLWPQNINHSLPLPLCLLLSHTTLCYNRVHYDSALLAWSNKDSFFLEPGVCLFALFNLSWCWAGPCFLLETQEVPWLGFYIFVLTFIFTDCFLLTLAMNSVLIALQC